MAKYFNTTGVCIPEKHYMVDLSAKVSQIINTLIKKEKYFTINKARQYGKTTTLYMLEKTLNNDYLVISLSFEAADDLFESRYNFALGFINKVSKKLNNIGANNELIKEWEQPISSELPFEDLGDRITALCKNSGKKVILMIDEVDKSSDNQIFLSFLGLLRTKYLDMQKGDDVSFTSVILAGVYDIKNIKLKYRNENETKYNSPWNIAADFKLDMSFSPDDIETMLEDYKRENRCLIDSRAISNEIFEYTAGYPYLVSRICQLIDENKDNGVNFDHEGILTALRMILKDKNTLFDDIQKKLSDFPELKDMLYAMLFKGITYPYHANSDIVSVGEDFGFIIEENNCVKVANRIYEIWLYNLFIAQEALNDKSYEAGLQAKNQFIHDGRFDMDKVMVKFYEHFSEIYAGSSEKFIEENGRRLFLLYLKPIINGTGNYYVESRTMSMGRTDIIVDYHGTRYVVELKIWHGKEYNERGEKQLVGYLDDYHMNKGYLLSFNFNKNKETGIKERYIGDKTIVEVVV